MIKVKVIIFYAYESFGFPGSTTEHTWIKTTLTLKNIDELLSKSQEIVNKQSSRQRLQITGITILEKGEV